MPLIPIGQTFWAVAVIVLAVALGVLAIAVIWSFERRRARQPDATRYEDLKERAAAIEVRIREREDLLREIDQRIHDRDRIGAEVAALTERRDNLRVELDALAGAEQQIEAMKQRAADAAAAFAVETAKLDEVKLALQETAGHLTEAQNRLDRLKKDADELEGRNKTLRETLPGEIEELHARLVELVNEKAVLDKEISQLRGVRESLFAAREETAALAVRNDALEARYKELRETLPEETKGLIDELARLRTEREALGQEIAEVQVTRESVLAAREEIAFLAARIEALNREIDVARKTHEDLLSGAELERPRQERVQLMDEIGTLRAERASLEQMATKATLEENIARLRGDASGVTAGGPDPATVAADLAQLPPCLVSVPSAAYPPQLEREALHDVAVHLAGLSLRYDQRTLYAFHTALKINETSQMTVLAGVSGTGKSLLPRRYAEAMGLHFLQISVEPRWDSPQDLLGFYNYIEKRYRATDLARALVHMDPYNTSGLSDRPHSDEVMLVLLDEMNLARVEYYFSEFLSRLEVRPRLAEAANAERRSGACLPIDIPGRAEGPIRLFPSHNVLFAGTMNDDESTQSLSDKVLDRSNVMQFAAPDRFARPVDGQPAAAMGRYRSFREWQKWIRPADQLAGGERDKVERVIGKLAQIMKDCGRPFGHRLNEAMLAYVANYPRDKGMAVDLPLADQIELRILPKLRGLTIEGHEQPFDDLNKLIGEDLGDRHLAEMLEHTVDRQGGSNGQFSWRGFSRGQA